MTGKYVLVTGATDGIGKQTALELAKLGATVLLHGRNPKRLIETMKEIHAKAPGAHLDTFNADFSSLTAVRKMALDLAQKYPRLDALINNAGVYMQRRELSRDGYEMTFAVNHLAPFLLTHLCLPLLKAAPSARVITVSSVAHLRATLDFDNLQGEKKFDGYDAYSRSKLANVLFAVELAERLKGEKIASNALHPGVIATKLLEAGFAMKGAPLEEGAETPVYLASSPDVEGVTGRYFVKKRPQPYNPIVDNAEIRKRFWELSKQMVGLN
ncbi:MAG: SDR family oxidoreductase [Chloroherpetonaceae bacterium]|nr:SDR family oxidoreductase [Chloroherpetonaceae bacterium]MDW8438109.1 SDR family oxidoreductase [Chloroherpetonaceae bacterium]